MKNGMKVKTEQNSDRFHCGTEANCSVSVSYPFCKDLLLKQTKVHIYTIITYDYLFDINTNPRSCLGIGNIQKP